MKTSAVIIIAIGALSLVGGVVALTLPYTGYPWLRHSVFLQVLGVCGIVVGAFISIYYLSNRDQGTRNLYGTKRKHGKTFEKYPDYLGKENLAGPEHPPVQIFTISEKEDTPAPYPNLPVYSRIEKQQLYSHPRHLPSKASSNIRHPKIQPVSSKPALSCISSTISMTTSNSAGSQHYHPQSSKKKVKSVRKDNKARKAGKAGKTGKAKSPGSIFNKRKSVAVSSHDGQERSIKPSESAGTPSISGVFSSLKKQAKKNKILQPKLHSHETTGHENLAGPQHQPEEEADIVTSEQNPDLSTTNNNSGCRSQAPVKKIPPGEKTESSTQGEVSTKPNNKAPDTGQKLVRQKSKPRIDLQVPEITDKQNKKSKPLDLTADTKLDGQYLFNWKKKRRNLKPKPKATKKIKKVTTLFGTGKTISPPKIYLDEISTGPIQPCNQHRENLESQHFSNLKSNQLMTSEQNPNPTGSCHDFQHLDQSTQILSHHEQPQVYTPSQRCQGEVSRGPIQLNTHHRDDLETQYFSNLKSNQLPTSAHNQNQTAQFFQHQDISTQILLNPAQKVYTPSPEELTKKSYSNEKGTIPISNNFMSTVPKTMEVPAKDDKISNKNRAPEKDKLDKDPTSNPGFISIKGSSITMEEMKNKLTSKHSNKIGFNFWQNKQEKKKGKTKTKKSLAGVRKAKHPYEKSPDMQRNNNVYGTLQFTETIKCQMDENRVENLEVKSFSKKIEQMNDNLKILSGDKSISEPVQKFDNLIGVNLNPGGRKLRQDTAGLGDSTDSLFSARDSLLSFGSTISTGSYNSAGSISNPLRSSLKKVKNKTTCESVLSTASGYSAASGRKSVRIAVGGEQTTV